MSKQKRKPRDKFKRIVDGSKPSAFIVSSGKTKHGLIRKFGKGEFVQAALFLIFREDPSKQNDIGVGHAKALVREVNDWLANDPAYRRKYRGAKVSNMTVTRELRKLRGNLIY
jgi:hypothetical protein